jgi:Sulfotransferase domain
MKRMYSELGIEVDEGELERVVDKHSWENIPEDQKGEGKFYRKATPGSWREDLTPEQAEAIERVTAPLLEDLYPHEVHSEERF